MSAFIIPNRDQMLLLTQVDLSTVAAEGSVVSLINELIDSLDTAEIESGYQAESDTGRPAFHPKTLLKVALLALHSCRFSLRKIEQDTENNLAYKWLTGDMIIDHSTMGLFLAHYASQIVELFSQVVGICKEQNLIEFDLLAVDSIKVRANANYKQSKTLEGINKEEHRIKERLEEILDTAADAESAEADAGFASMENHEKLEAEGQEVLIPDGGWKWRKTAARRRGITIVRNSLIEQTATLTAVRAGRDCAIQGPCRSTGVATIATRTRAPVRDARSGADAQKGRTGGCSGTTTKGFVNGYVRS